MTEQAFMPGAGNTMYLGGLAPSITAEVVEGMLSTFGPILNIEIPIDETTRSHRGFAFVTFSEEDDCKEAIANVDKSELMGRVLVAKKASPNALYRDTERAIWHDEGYIRKGEEESGEKYDSAQKEGDGFFFEKEDDEKEREDEDEKKAKKVFFAPAKPVF